VSLLTVIKHKIRHQNGGSDEISVTGLSGLLADDQHVLDAEVQAIKLDAFTAPDDGAKLDVSTSLHGLAPKAVAPAAGLLNVYGIANGETAITNKPAFDSTNPAALGTASPGTQVIAARRDHVHPDPVPAHNLLVPSTTVHYDNSLCRYYLSADQANIPGTSRIELDTLLYDLGSNFTTANWYGASGAYRPSDADSDATHIEDDDANFPVAIVYSLVRWASDAAGTLNVGTGYITTLDVDTLTIVKATGADFAASYYYWIKKNHYVVPVTGYYSIIGNARIDPTEDQKRYNIAIYKGNVSIMQDSRHASGIIPLVAIVPTFANLTAGDLLCLVVSGSSLAGTFTVKGGAAEAYASYTSLMVKLLQKT
jgi:hypothetical protein